MNNRLYNEELEIVKRQREITKDLDINELVEVIDDYSVYNLFEPLLLIDNNNLSYYEYYVESNRNRNLDDVCIYRIKVYHLLKNSGYDDWYIEDNIEKYTEILMSFYKSSDDINKFISMYNKDKIKCLKKGCYR